MEKNKVIEDFFKYYQELPIHDKYKLGKIFQEEIGGKLSPHNNPINVGVAVVPVYDKEGKVCLLGIERGIPPHVGGFALPGGFQEAKEPIELTASRELYEETGIELPPEKFEIFGNPSLSQTNNQLVFLKYKEILPYEFYLEVKKDPSKYSSEIGSYILIDETTELCFSLHKEKVDTFFEQIKLEKNNKRNKKLAF